MITTAVKWMTVLMAVVIKTPIGVPLLFVKSSWSPASRRKESRKSSDEKLFETSIRGFEKFERWAAA